MIAGEDSDSDSLPGANLLGLGYGSEDGGDSDEDGAGVKKEEKGGEVGKEEGGPKATEGVEREEELKKEELGRVESRPSPVVSGAASLADAQPVVAHTAVAEAAQPPKAIPEPPLFGKGQR